MPTFEEETLFGALRSHLKPVYTDPDKAQDVLVTIPFGESETIEINASEISNSDMKLFVLDMPGMGNSNGCELGIVNGLNISSALRACANGVGAERSLSGRPHGQRHHDREGLQPHRHGHGGQLRVREALLVRVHKDEARVGLDHQQHL